MHDLDEMTADHDSAGAPHALTPGEPLPASFERKPVESWARELGTEDWLFAAAKMHARWPTGREVTRSEFDAAVKAAGDVTCR